MEHATNAGEIWFLADLVRWVGGRPETIDTAEVRTQYAAEQWARAQLAGAGPDDEVRLNAAQYITRAGRYRFVCHGTAFREGGRVGGRVAIDWWVWK